MKQLYQEFLDFYRNQLLLGFFKKRGKSLVVPQVLFCIERLMEQYPKKEVIRVLDLGCGEAHLLQILHQATSIFGTDKKVELYGFDNDEEMLQAARSRNNVRAEYVKFDIRHDDFSRYDGYFDVIVSVNTLHEVFSSYLGEGNKKFPVGKVEYAREQICSIITKIAKMLTEDGSLVLYDGLLPPRELMQERIKFKIINPILLHYFKQMTGEFTLWPISYKLTKDVVEMSYQDFCWFVTTFKYLNTKLWHFENQQVYQYMSEREINECFAEAGLRRESFMHVSNDLGLWQNNVEIVGKKFSYPVKSYLLVGSKHYIPSRYDYFGAS